MQRKDCRGLERGAQSQPGGGQEGFLEEASLVGGLGGEVGRDASSQGSRVRAERAGPGLMPTFSCGPHRGQRLQSGRG